MDGLIGSLQDAKDNPESQENREIDLNEEYSDSDDEIYFTNHKQLSEYLLQIEEENLFMMNLI